MRDLPTVSSPIHLLVPADCRVVIVCKLVVVS